MSQLVGQYQTVEINSKRRVNVKRFNAEVRRCKLARASYVPHVRLVGGNKRSK